MYVRALALVVVLAVAQWAWRAHADHSNASALAAFSKDWSPVATQAALLMVPPLTTGGGASFGAWRDLTSARAPSAALRPELALRRDVSP